MQKCLSNDLVIFMVIHVIVSMYVGEGTTPMAVSRITFFSQFGKSLTDFGLVTTRVYQTINHVHAVLTKRKNMLQFL